MSTGTAVSAAPVAPVPESASAARSADLPPEYAAMKDPPRFNSNEPRLIPDPAELSHLKFQVPQWMAQFLMFPPPQELIHFLGRPQPDTRRRAAEAIAHVVSPRFLPQGYAQRLIPLARWAILYEDWRNHGGTDVFLIKFQQEQYTIEIAEGHNHVLVFVRDLDLKRTEDFAAMLKAAGNYAELMLNEHLKPVSREAMKLFRANNSPPFIYGYYTPKIEAFAGTSGQTGDLLTTGGEANESFTSARATAVRFFTNGEFVAFMVLKPVFGGELRNPFEPRFDPLYMTRSDEVPFWERETAAVVEAPGASDQVKRKQVEEYLGNYFYDEAGNKIIEHMPIRELEKAFLELSPEQKLAIVERKMIDEYYTNGMKAFAARDYRSALDYWSKILNLEPDNPRAAILLQVAVRIRTEENFQGDVERAKRDDQPISAALDSVSRQQTLLVLKREQKQQEKLKDRAIVDFRTRALNFLSEGNYSDSLKEWNKLLTIDPGNATALNFRDICEKRVKGPGGGR